MDMGTFIRACTFVNGNETLLPTPSSAKGLKGELGASVTASHQPAALLKPTTLNTPYQSRCHIDTILPYQQYLSTLKYRFSKSHLLVFPYFSTLIFKEFFLYFKQIGIPFFITADKFKSGSHPCNHASPETMGRDVFFNDMKTVLAWIFSKYLTDRTFCKSSLTEGTKDEIIGNHILCLMIGPCSCRQTHKACQMLLIVNQIYHGLIVEITVRGSF